jgi:hypothetical protein
VGRASRAVCLTLMAGIALAIGGCCRGSSTHSCEFAEPNPDAGDGGSDAGPAVCGTEVCDMGTVCCVTKSPPLAQCIDPARFDSLGCEKANLPCVLPGDCPSGMSCCLVVSPDISSATVSCQQELQCLAGAMSFVTCGSDADCPHARPTCTALPTTTGQSTYSICE